MTLDRSMEPLLYNLDKYETYLQMQKSELRRRRNGIWRNISRKREKSEIILKIIQKKLWNLQKHEVKSNHGILNGNKEVENCKLHFISS